MLKSTLSFILFIYCFFGGSVLSFVEITNNTVMYKVDQAFMPSEKKYIQDKMAQIESKTCLVFRELIQDIWPPHASYINIIFREERHSCQASDLELLIPQAILAPHCFDDGWVIHELLHTMGWYDHEHQREDRDCYVEVHSSKLRDHNYVKHVPTDTRFPYDVSSVMHYRRGPFLQEAEHVVDRGSQLGSRDILTEMDVWKLNHKFCKGPLYCDTHKEQCDRINATNFSKGCLPKTVYLPSRQKSDVP